LVSGKPTKKGDKKLKRGAQKRKSKFPPEYPLEKKKLATGKEREGKGRIQLCRYWVVFRRGVGKGGSTLDILSPPSETKNSTCARGRGMENRFTRRGKEKGTKRRGTKLPFKPRKKRKSQKTPANR